MNHRPICPDAHSIILFAQRVLAAMLPCFTENFGDPARNNHVYGGEASTAVKNARKAISPKHLR